MSPRSAGPPRGLRLEIGELHLHGFGAEHRERFEAILRAELATLAAGRREPHLSGRPPAIEHLRHQASATEPEAAARETARVIWARLAPPIPNGRAP